MSELDVRALLYQGYASPHGIAVSTNNFQLAQQALYKARRKLMDPDLDILQFRRSPHNEAELWIIKATGRKTATPIASPETQTP